MQRNPALPPIVYLLYYSFVYEREREEEEKGESRARIRSIGNIWSNNVCIDFENLDNIFSLYIVWYQL